MRKSLATLFLSTMLATPALAEAPKVVTSIKPVHSLVAAVMGEVGEPTLLVKGGASPHTYALKPSDAEALENADLIFWIGHDLERFLEGPIETLGADAAVISLDKAHELVALPLREGGAFAAHDHDHEEHAGHEDDDHQGEGEDHEGHVDQEDHAHEGEDHDGHEGEHSADEIDPHIWLDPVNAKAMVHEIAEALAGADPANAALYEQNAAATEAALDALVAEVDAIVAPVRDKPFVAFHDAYQYFENRFGMAAAGTITVSPDAMPGVQRLSEIQHKLGELDAACVFAEPQFEPRIITVVTEGTNARSGVLDPLGADLADGPELYPALVRGLAESFADCLAE
jgi:zinc transport system substrate-binding protein